MRSVIAFAPDGSSAWSAQVSGTNVATNSNWSRISATGTAPAGTTVAYCLVLIASSGTLPSVGSQLDIDAAMLTDGSTVFTYGDGSSPGWSWSGTQNGSISSGPPVRN